MSSDWVFSSQQEIESIDVPEEAEAKVEEKQTPELKPPEPKPADPAPDSDADNGIGTSEDDACPPVEPKGSCCKSIMVAPFVHSDNLNSTFPR